MGFNGCILRHASRTPALRPRGPAPDLTPDNEALRHSRRLVTRIHEVIAEAGGWIGFDRYMALSLYEPGLGYYAGGSTKFGGAGDFVTAPEISPLFGRTLARQVADVLAETGGDLLEIGPGTGRLAADILRGLAELGSLPRRYSLLELSGELRARQEATIRSVVPSLADRVEWLDALPKSFTGIVLANELLDAVPVQVVALDEGVWRECGVSRSGDGLAWALRPLHDDALRREAEALDVPSPYRTEISLQAEALVGTIASRLTRGAMVFIDYGFGRREYYHPQRNAGTLMCHYRHHALDDPFHLPGLQDITAHVDFTRIASAAVREGMTFAGYTNQAHLLVNCGITDVLGQVSPEQTGRYLPLAAQAQKLLGPHEMGELFKAIAFTRDISPRLRGFTQGDLSRLL